MRMNFETGKREAKLMDGDSGIKHWNSGEKQGMSDLQIRVRNRKLIFLFLNQNICCGYSNESYH